MEGIGKSVFYGTRIENFAVEVLDVVIGKISIKAILWLKLLMKK
jgi:hypothetical protein